MMEIEIMSVETGRDLSTLRIDVSHLPAGDYFIRLVDKMVKLVKIHKLCLFNSKIYYEYFFILKR
jgi:hypothetical protein